ncbi:hypothetical protein GR925_28245 [Streptomyces sp. HUCO-GS316]|uniref:hypothetical protein n=1 Tax=Streptomyces sp. HUCO-GS316 TaxID=2692198 RepID=UPI00136E7A72|nr:hypothetical protein [Streptomyces sp. HUCO-GS316]MXM67217.1 hypothetical protein [Streptomyces sp. HUCO-GS316]
MGERLSGGESGRRRAHPGDALEIEALLVAAMRVDGHDTEAEQRAVNAFRTARDAGAHRARTRRRDDWRPREQRRVVRSMKVTFSLFLASLTLGGVAVAAIGSYTDSHDSAEQPGESATGRPEAGPAATSAAGSEAKERPDTAKDAEAHCRAYEQVKERGLALGSTAWQRLVTAAGGEQNVPVYCADLLAKAKATATAAATADSKPTKPERTNNPDQENNSGTGGENTSNAGQGNNSGAGTEKSDTPQGKNR